MSPLEGKVFLVVDDEELVREVLAEELTLFGARVLTAPNGSEALEILRKQRFDAVFADIRMPGGDGLFLVESLNKDTGEKPLVFLCSGLMDVSIPDPQRLGIAAIIKKPFDCATLIKTVTEAFDRARIRK